VADISFSYPFLNCLQ